MKEPCSKWLTPLCVTSVDAPRSSVQRPHGGGAGREHWLADADEAGASLRFRISGVGFRGLRLM